MTKKKREEGKAPLESEIQRVICDWLALTGLFFWRANNIAALGRFGKEGEARFRSLPKYTPRGIPDLFLLDSGRFIGVEIKRPGRKPTPEQVAFGAKLYENGGEYHIVHSLEEAQELIAGLYRRAK